MELKLKEGQIVEAVCALNEAMPTLVKGAAQADASKVFGEFATKSAFVVNTFLSDESYS